MRDGIIVVLALHANSAVFVNDDEAGLLEDISEWLDKLVPSSDTYHHNAKGSRAESSAASHLQGLLLNQQVVLSFTEGRLEMGPWQQLLYAELDGQRPKRIHIKLLGE
jgi:secondary thiamine-phosphate synthase enzyme